MKNMNKCSLKSLVFFVSGNRVANRAALTDMATGMVSLATVGVISVILGIFSQNGRLVKIWSYLWPLQKPEPSVLDSFDIRNSSYQFNYDHAHSVRQENMHKYDFKYIPRGVDRRSNLSLQEFIEVYDSKWPVLITDVVPTWKASNWTPEFFLQHYKDDRVTMKAVHGKMDSGKGLALPLFLFLQNIHKSDEMMWTYLEDELFLHTRPELRKDIGDCKYLNEDFFSLFPPSVIPWNAMMLWGTAHSRSSLHIDPYNWTGTNAVLSGTKKWKLFPPGQDHLLYVVHDRRCGFPLDCFKYNSEVDTFAVDEERYPLFKQARYIEFEQKAGELLIIPTGWFHQAYNSEVTLAVSSQVMNSQNYLVVLEEIIKAGNIKRSSLPLHFATLSPKGQVKTVASLLSPDILEKGQKLTEKILKEVQGNVERS
ncbi:uncharacterized protein LOC135474836 [Liolophura sinensis]|uniref:uncharacterized protein LOC135474836 n=1 Tax=Liolophura sinensis TaxID=3198878 RepID=UPI003159521B